jgi:dTDP-L-rhamnose 4-epimerase
LVLITAARIVHMRAVMKRRVLITGGAGFIGSHLADELLARGYSVRALDSLIPQVHGGDRRRPAYLAPEVELLVGDVRDPAVVHRALEGVDVVYHLAARIGVGQSMLEVAEYTSVNNIGTAVLLEALIARPVQRLIVASSMATYGEGLYRDGNEQVVSNAARTPKQLERREWEPFAANGVALTPVPTPEWKPATLSSVYALSKHDQERIGLMTGAAYKIPTVVLRFFNVYGPRQAASSPYSAVLGSFAARLVSNKAPLLFEDGNQRRDFVHIRDAVMACRLALEVDAAVGQVFNIGSGRDSTIREVALRMSRVLGKNIAPEITGQYRVGDIRHCFADIGHARGVLGYRPAVDFDAGLAETAAWLATRTVIDQVESKQRPRRGLAL